jgi:hypothetical protein
MYYPNQLCRDEILLGEKHFFKNQKAVSVISYKGKEYFYDVNDGLNHFALPYRACTIQNSLTLY